MALEYRIGTSTDIYEFELLSDILPNHGKPVDPDWSYRPYANSVKLGNGHDKGMGYPSATWRWNQLPDAAREVLRTLCPGLSSNVYIRTPINETSSGVKTWKTFQAIMHWTPEDEDKQAGRTLGIVVVFTHLVEVV